MSTETKTTPTETTQALVETTEQQAERALVNQGNTVRASWRFSMDSVRPNISHMSPEAKDLLVWCMTWCIDPAHAVSFAEFADRVGISENTAYKIFSGKYLHPESKARMDLSDKLLKGLRDFRRIELSRAKLGRKRFILTPTAKKVFWACDQARKSNTPVMVYGASHIGKTEAFRQYCIDNNHGKSILVELEAVSGLALLLKAIAEKLGVSPNTNTPDLIARIKKALTPDMVLVLDELHILANTYRRGSFFACMEQLRRIYDATQCGMVFSYTELGFAQVEKERKRELMQIFRRGVHKVNLGSEPTVEDVRLITNSFGLPWSEVKDDVQVTKEIQDTPHAVLKQLAKEEGLKAIVERIRLANDYAADHEREEITWHDFLIAHYAIVRNAQTPASGW